MRCDARAAAGQLPPSRRGLVGAPAWPWLGAGLASASRAAGKGASGEAQVATDHGFRYRERFGRSSRAARLANASRNSRLTMIAIEGGCLAIALAGVGPWLSWVKERRHWRGLRRGPKELVRDGRMM